MNYKIIGKYIKDLSFSIPNPKVFSSLSKDISKYKINIDIRSAQIKQNMIEVWLHNLTPIKNDFERINTKIVFATIVELTTDKMKKEDIERIVLIQVPSQIYSELRNIFINLFENSGFKDIKINENVDFQRLFEMRKIQ